MIRPEDVFNPNDFQSIALQLTMKNLTTSTEVRDAELVSLVELGEKTLTLELPAKSCNTKHNLFILIKRKNPDSDSYQDVCSLTGKVLEAEQVGPEELRAVLDVIQVDEYSWHELKKMFSSRQEQITNFLRAVRG